MADLYRRPHFTSPFLLACASRNARLVNPAVSCLYRLVVSKAVSKERLNEVVTSYEEVNTLGKIVLDGFGELIVTIMLGSEIQLKILQSLPHLFHQYADDIHGSLLYASLQLCASSLSPKFPGNHGTATATLQQLLHGVFDKVVLEDSKSINSHLSTGCLTVMKRTHFKFHPTSNYPLLERPLW